MKNLSKKSFYLFIILISLSSCQSLKDGLTGNKKASGDEFLVEKKNPLVLPPEFGKLPEPETLISKNEDEEDIDLRDILGNNKNSKKISSTKKTTSDSLEKSIIEKIKDN